MNKAIPQKSIIFTLLLSFLPLFSEIIEIKHFHEIVHYCTPGALVLLDMDNTTLEPEHESQVASEQWFSTLIRKFPTIDAAISHYCATALNTPMKTVEPTIPEILHAIQEQALLLGFTMRSLVLAPQTVQALHHNGINLLSQIPDQGFMIEDQFPVLVYHDIIFCQGRKNGVTLFDVLDANGICPETIVMIDDKRQYLEVIERACTKRGIKFIGLRYGYLDEKVKQFLAQHSL
jgi:hypothetical protein